VIAASDALAPATLWACAAGIVALPIWWRVVRQRDIAPPVPLKKALDAVWPVPCGLLLFVVYGLLLGAAMIAIQESLLNTARMALASAVLVGVAVGAVGLPRLLCSTVGVGRAIALGALTFAAALPVVYGIAYVESLFVGEMPQQDMVLRIGRGGVGVRELVFMAGAVAPFIEEIIFRGLIYGGVSRSRGPRYALHFSALIFGVVHYNPWVAILPMVALGYFLGALVQRTGSVLACFVAHALFNLLSVAVLVFG